MNKDELEEALENLEDGYRNLQFKYNKLIGEFIERLESHEFMEGDDILEEIQYWEERRK